MASLGAGVWAQSTDELAGAAKKGDNAALQQLRALADKGDARAEVNLGGMYYNGDGVPKDAVQAVAWYRKVADQGLGIKYEVHGTPKDVEGARALAAQDKYQFQWWAVSLVNAVPFGGKKKGADSGIDGLIYFKPEGKTTEKAIVSVKGGDNVTVAMVRDLAHVVNREKAQIGVFITLADSTGPMRTEAVKAGYYETLYGKHPKIQIFTIADLFDGKQPNIPLVDSAAFKKAPKEKEGGEQDTLPF